MKAQTLIRGLVGCLALGLMLTAWSGTALALEEQKAIIKVEEATLALQEFMTQPDASSAQYLLKRGKAVAIFPGLVKAGFIVGGQYGTGVVLVRQENGEFGPPAFLTMGGASVGLQIGAQAVNLFMVIMNDKGLHGLYKNQLKMGADASVAAGPVGRQTDASLSALSMKADIFSYSMTKGLFAGVSLEGVGLEFDYDTTAAYYHHKAGIMDVLNGVKVTPPPSAKKLMKTVDKFAR
ncbi:MAG: lipid-binding SYLF domain-containing protein [Deltaproteobacteria bacterium]|nr:lipid-binding SYLF domain-containing protein [Deltaproteobacteria bacterium]